MRWNLREAGWEAWPWNNLCSAVGLAIFLLTQGLALQPFIWMSCPARPGLQGPSRWAVELVPGAQHQDVLNRESWTSACPLGQHCPLGLVFDFILDGQRICSDWLSRWPKCHWPEEQLDKDPFLKGSGLSHLCPSGSPTHGWSKGPTPGSWHSASPLLVGIWQPSVHLATTLPDILLPQGITSYRAPIALFSPASPSYLEIYLVYLEQP